MVMKRIRTLMVLSIISTLFVVFSCSKKEETPPPVTGLPKVSTSTVSNITKISAEGGGNVISQGNSAISARGVCYDIAPNPTLSGHFTMDGFYTGVFYSYLNQLKQHTTYYVRAYATNASGTAYGDQQTFRTLWDSGYATVSTSNPTVVSLTWFEIGGNVSDDGGFPVTESGICWNTAPSPTPGNHKIACSSGKGSFSTEVNSLEMNTLYYARAYAINATGISYGNEKQIRTVTYPVLFVPGSYQGWNPGDSSTVITSVKDNEKFEGYFWFPANTEYKYTQEPSWVTFWGDNNHDGNLQLNGANLSVTDAGYYKLNVDLAALKHWFLKTEWGVVGTATPGGWITDIDLAYEPTTKLWTVTANLTAGELKFRANHGWDLNYGDDNADGTLVEGGSNIVVGAAGNYSIILDFRKPVYRYTLVKN